MCFHKIWLYVILIMCKHTISGSKEMPLQFEYILAKHPEATIGEFRCTNTAYLDYFCCTLHGINSKMFDGNVKFCINARYIYDVELYTADFKPQLQGKLILDMLKTFADTWSTATKIYSVQLIDASNIKQLGLLTRGTTYYEIHDFACNKYTPKFKSKFDKITNVEVTWTDIEDCMNEYFFTSTRFDEEANICLKKMKNEFHTFKPKNMDKLKLKEYWKIMQKTMEICDVYAYDSKTAGLVRFGKHQFPRELSSCIISQQLYVDEVSVNNLMQEKATSCTKMKYSGKHENKDTSLELSVSALLSGYASMDLDAYRIGQIVECRDWHSNWQEGVITDLTPLKVKKNGWFESFEWNEVRKLSSNFAVGDKVNVKDNDGIKWYNGVVRSTDPLEVSVGDDYHGFAWDCVKAIKQM